MTLNTCLVAVVVDAVVDDLPPSGFSHGIIRAFEPDAVAAVVFGFALHPLHGVT